MQSILLTVHDIFATNSKFIIKISLTFSVEEQ